MILLIENIISGGNSSLMANPYVKSDDNKKILFAYAINIYGHSMSQPLPYDEIKLDKNVKLEVIINTLDDSDIG